MNNSLRYRQTRARARTAVLITLVAATLLGAAGCAIIQPRRLRPNWVWDGTPRTMPNSMFEPVARAREVEAEPATPSPSPGSLREELILDGPWQYRPDPEEKGERDGWFASGLDLSAWKTMAVPNNFTIDDPALKSFYRPVWFRRAFVVPASFAGKRVRLVFEAVDYFAKVWVNGELLGEHEGYFNPFSFDVAARLKPGENVVAVMVTNPWDGSMDVAERAVTVAGAEKIWVKSVFAFHDSRPGGDSRRAIDSQSFGTGGICRPVKLVATGELALDWVLVSPRLFDDYTRAEATFQVFVTNFGAAAREALVTVEAAGENFSGYADTLAVRALLNPGANQVTLVLPIAQPRLWWPWSHPELGAPNLYRARITVADGPGASDERREIFGLKEVKLAETGPQAFFWHVNGKRLFFRGTNGIPSEYVSKYTPAYLDAYFSKLKDNNIDLMIVHDHQAPPMLYEAADRAGMPILQNFTLIWEVNVCDFVRPNGDPSLTSNAEVIGRMATEAIWYLYNHPSIMWWSMHDESDHIEFGGRGLLHGNFCREEPYRPGEKFAMFQDMSLNLDLDNQIIRIARELNPYIPMHRTGGLETDSTTWYGWYQRTYWDLYDDPEQFPVEFGAQGVSYSIAGVMNYFDGWWPIGDKDERAREEWKYHSFQTESSDTYIGRSRFYGSFNEWAFASQLYQAIVIKYDAEINRENRYHPTGSALQYMYNDWWPSVNFGFTDWNLVEKISLSWLRRSFTPQLAATRVRRNIYQPGDKIFIPLHAINDQHLDFRRARLAWKLVEETDGFILVGNKSFRPNVPIGSMFKPEAMIASLTLHPVTATIGHQQPLALILSGDTVFDLGPDGNTVAAFVRYTAPATKKPRHFTLYLYLTSAEGQVLSENWDHFLVAPRGFDPPEGISPAPRFRLELTVTKSGAPVSGPVTIRDKYNPGRAVAAELDREGRVALPEMLPGAYRLEAAQGSSEFLLNRDERLELDLAAGARLGTEPIINWGPEMQRP
jgi:beta-mannosidase